MSRRRVTLCLMSPTTKGQNMKTGREPTPQEVKETNPRMTRACDKCGLVVRANAHFGTFENMLSITMSGGYGEYVDSVGVRNPEDLEFALCHKCAHNLMNRFFGKWVTPNWHPRTKDRYCDGWRHDYNEANIEALAKAARAQYMED